ncbi:DUF6412 domain-containing protein [Amycolatopsis sp. NBC_00345]|uniref:DUF6412 domain-containing protein n=1 Tax=Amycolatopsis sp. NBC_00345 TaxID=2975955 RepID=UPI002E255E19
MDTLLDLAFPALMSPAGLVAFASVVAAGLLVVLVVGYANRGELSLWAIPVRSRFTALNQRARRAAFLRLRDPSAPGRCRPRAPGLPSSAA